ncbi:MAG: hypothetical protein WCP77_00260 [Roseococcus sp.]
MRDRDDMGPSVRGFGDSIPAFMLIPIPRPKRPAAEAPTGDQPVTDMPVPEMSVTEIPAGDTPTEFVAAAPQDTDAAA